MVANLEERIIIDSHLEKNDEREFFVPYFFVSSSIYFANLLTVIKYIPGQIQGQTGREERDAERYYSAEGHDDKILQTCLQLQLVKGNLVMLYTADKNLANKALVSKVKAVW